MYAWSTPSREHVTYQHWRLSLLWWKTMLYASSIFILRILRNDLEILELFEHLEVRIGKSMFTQNISQVLTFEKYLRDH